jgi:hypothetical protein
MRATALQVNRFMGVSSGRVGTDIPETPIGRVWKPEVIDQIIG